MASVAAPHIEDAAREVRALIRFVDPGDFLTRRYVSQGAEINTGTYSDHEVIIRDGMPIRDHFTLDEHGFVVVDVTADPHGGLLGSLLAGLLG